ncbi:MAG: hypothetical protein KF871_09810 [Hydrogenophaga sp.]|uniref:hypothetical protein n=1 Tax=Hydrogenophaga sp. TaxID=1904254 RepID=UPI001D29FFBA|nr:hypothetical protein [Hydrogenophaga sp.]MBX3610181.1 hypothetical protein [Hydrogenophaga sp.]
MIAYTKAAHITFKTTRQAQTTPTQSAGVTLVFSASGRASPPPLRFIVSNPDAAIIYLQRALTLNHIIKTQGDPRLDSTKQTTRPRGQVQPKSQSDDAKLILSIRRDMYLAAALAAMQPPQPRFVAVKPAPADARQSMQRAASTSSLTAHQSPEGHSKAIVVYRRPTSRPETAPRQPIAQPAALESAFSVMSSIRGGVDLNDPERQRKREALDEAMDNLSGSAVRDEEATRANPTDMEPKASDNVDLEAYTRALQEQGIGPTSADSPYAAYADALIQQGMPDFQNPSFNPSPAAESVHPERTTTAEVDYAAYTRALEDHRAIAISNERAAEYAMHLTEAGIVQSKQAPDPTPEATSPAPMAPAVDYNAYAAHLAQADDYAAYAAALSQGGVADDSEPQDGKA